MCAYGTNAYPRWCNSVFLWDCFQAKSCSFIGPNHGEDHYAADLLATRWPQLRQFRGSPVHFKGSVEQMQAKYNLHRKIFIDKIVFSRRIHPKCTHHKTKSTNKAIVRLLYPLMSRAINQHCLLQQACLHLLLLVVEIGWSLKMIKSTFSRENYFICPKKKFYFLFWPVDPFIFEVTYLVQKLSSVPYIAFLLAFKSGIKWRVYPWMKKNEWVQSSVSLCLILSNISHCSQIMYSLFYAIMTIFNHAKYC